MGAVCSVPALRMTGNFFIVNLALADILVTSVTQPANILGKGKEDLITVFAEINAHPEISAH